MKEFTPEYIDELKRLAEMRDEAAAKELMDDLHPADIAEFFQELDHDEFQFFVDLLDDDTAADVLMEMD